jgi:hypothetical protein
MAPAPSYNLIGLSSHAKGEWFPLDMFVGCDGSRPDCGAEGGLGCTRCRLWDRSSTLHQTRYM